MYARFRDDLSLRELARTAFMSPYHFHRTFRRLTGVPPCQFLSAVRLATARRLLLTTQASVTEICFEVGYNSLGTFIRRFTELLGLSPSRFRALVCDTKILMSRKLVDSLQYQFASDIVGKISVPDFFDGFVFIGLFKSLIPTSTVVSYTLASDSGTYRISPVPNGRFFLIAIGISHSNNMNDYFLYESALRGGGQIITVREGVAEGIVDLALREASRFDPPILMVFPHLLTRHKLFQPSFPEVIRRG
jgi:AraC family transcriptional regulator